MAWSAMAEWAAAAQAELEELTSNSRKPLAPGPTSG
jgi:hypothetical protein